MQSAGDTNGSKPIEPESDSAIEHSKRHPVQHAAEQWRTENFVKGAMAIEVVPPVGSRGKASDQGVRGPKLLEAGGLEPF
jgi:hypothetical protein